MSHFPIFVSETEAMRHREAERVEKQLQEVFLDGQRPLYIPTSAQVSVFSVFGVIFIFYTILGLFLYKFVSTARKSDAIPFTFDHRSVGGSCCFGKR